MRLAILGAGGRMGQALIRAIESNEETVLSAAVDRPQAECIGKDSGFLAGTEANGISISDDVDEAIATSDAIIDFTAPASTVALAKRVGGTKCAHVIGTTGCTSEDQKVIEEAAKDATIVMSGNMSLGVNLLAVLVEQAAKALPADTFDIEVLEMHHRHKVDAPSGTALLLGSAAAKGRDIDLDEHAVRSRDGITGEREEGTIGFATLRGGAVVGDHTVILASNGERIELTHKAQDRSLFANGAVHAALWTKGKTSGFYSMRDVLGI